jgi:hypothetical protein
MAVAIAHRLRQRGMSLGVVRCVISAVDPQQFLAAGYLITDGGQVVLQDTPHGAADAQHGMGAAWCINLRLIRAQFACREVI